MKAAAGEKRMIAEAETQAIAWRRSRRATRGRPPPPRSEVATLVNSAHSRRAPLLPRRATEMEQWFKDPLAGVVATLTPRSKWCAPPTRHAKTVTRVRCGHSCGGQRRGGRCSRAMKDGQTLLYIPAYTSGQSTWRSCCWTKARRSIGQIRTVRRRLLYMSVTIIGLQGRQVVCDFQKSHRHAFAGELLMGCQGKTPPAIAKSRERSR